MSVMMLQTKCKLNNTDRELFLKLFHIQSKENWKQWARSIRPKFPKIPVQNRMELTFSGNSFRKFRFTSRGCPFFWKFGNYGNFLFHLSFLPGMNRPQFRSEEHTSELQSR